MAEKTLDLEVLYIAHGDPAKGARLGLCVVTKAPGWPWSKAEHGEVGSTTGMYFAVARLPVTLEQMRLIALHRLCVDNCAAPQRLVESPREWWIEEDPPQAFWGI